MKGFLILESGESYSGLWHGGKNGETDRAGEVVFNTSHSGYEEIATDPSYFSQIVVLTAPMQGNYSADDAVWESNQLWIQGFVCVEVQNSQRDRAWIEKLNKAKIPILSELDTRKLTLNLRNGGTQWGALVQADDLQVAKEKAMTLIKSQKAMDADWVYLASRKSEETVKGEKEDGPKIAVIDFGTKLNIIRLLQDKCSEVKIFPARTSSEKILQYNPSGILLTNGPGDPAAAEVSTESVKQLLGKKPIFGICMGHQILSIALGAKTFKLKFGHRGSNHPIKDELLNRIYVSSQNHGYAVDPNTLPADVKVTHINLNDRTVAGIYSEKNKCLGIQFHPESCPGPHDARVLFDYFIERMVL